MGRMFCFAVALVAPLLAQGGSWSAPIALSTGGQGWESAAAMDGAGNSVALWDERTTQDQLWSRAKPAGGNWSTAQGVSPALQTTLVFPAVRITPAGFATAVWTDSNGVWTADRPSNGQWNAAQLLVPGGAGPIFVMNARGDAAVVWTLGSPPGPRTFVMARLRPAGGAWTAPQTIASGRFRGRGPRGHQRNR